MDVREGDPAAAPRVYDARRVSPPVHAVRGGWRARRWPIAVALLVCAVAALVVAASFALRKATAAQSRLLDREVAALVSVRALEGASQLRARLAREALLAPTPQARGAADAAYADVVDRLDRLAPLVETAEERDIVARARAGQEQTMRAWREILDARARGEPVDALVARMQQRVAPVRWRLDADYARLAALHEAALARGRVEADAAGRAAAGGLLLAGALALLVVGAMAGLLRRSIAALGRSEARYRASFDHAAIGIAHVALDGRWLRANRRLQSILGYAEHELRLRTLADLAAPGDGALDPLASERPDPELYGVEKRLVRKDGRTVWVNLTLSLVRDGRGRARYLIAAVEAIDARKRVEHELRDAVRARDEFLAVASHELRTPLTSLGLQLDALRIALAREPLDVGRLRARAQTARRQADRLGTLVSELLDVSRCAEVDVSVDPEDGDLVRCARTLVERVAPDALRAGCALALVAPEAVRARFDPLRLEQALTHVLGNAIKYGAGRPVDVVVERSADRARVVVRDHGIGLDPQERERIFERFERAVSSRHYGGLGLGLFLARRIVEAHDGTISVESAPGEGATFAVELPVAGPRATATTA
jgi:PAS domain S-box-containing protein